MKGWGRGLVLTGLMSATLSAPLFAADAVGDLGQALSGGKVNAELRARWENVGQGNALDDANAYTLRGRLGYTTAQWNQLDLLSEFSGTFLLGPDTYNSGSNGKTGRSTVVDPKGTQLNQFSLHYSGLAGNDFRLGRQRLLLDNQRFVGNSDWRQSEVTFDAFSVVNTQLPNTRLSYAYIDRVNDKNFTAFSMKGHLLNAAYAAMPQLNLVAYAYLLDFGHKPASATSCSFAALNAQQRAITRCDSQTYGVRASGAAPFDAFKLVYAAEYAHQNHLADAPAAVGAAYYLAEFGAASHGVTAKLGYEDLKGDGNYSFQTPLATLHAFNGWADMFLNTPDKGLRDAYVRIEGEAPYGIKLLGSYHDFRSDEGHQKFGSEFDLQAARSVGKALNLMAKYADFNSSMNAAPFVDTRKFWLQAQYRF